MIGRFLGTCALAGLLLTGVTGTARAGDGAALAAWKADCGNMIDRMMKTSFLPASARLTPNGYNIVEAVVDRSGQVIEARLAKKSGKIRLDQASKILATRLETLPELPSDIADERVLVRIYLVYADSRATERRLLDLAKARTRVDRAGRDTGSSTRIAGLPVVDLVSGM